MVSSGPIRIWWPTTILRPGKSPSSDWSARGHLLYFIVALTFVICQVNHLLVRYRYSGHKSVKSLIVTGFGFMGWYRSVPTYTVPVRYCHQCCGAGAGRSRYFFGRSWSRCKDVKAKTCFLLLFSLFYMKRSRSR